MTAHYPSASVLRESYLSVSIATLIVLLWFLTAYGSLFVLPNVKEMALMPVVGVMTVRAFLHTGLFILAHDAMHGTLMPAYPKVNDWVGQAILRLYSFLSFQQMRDCHNQHHRTPAQSTDPDFYPGNFIAWYIHFMRTYIRDGQGAVIFWGMSFFFYPLLLIFHVPLFNAVLFWLLPQALSSLQLFYFGTYRPHKRPNGGHINAHRATSSNAAPLLSFLSCYHFDYHWEHHQYPHLPWYKLPSAHIR
ncbi:MAG: fatty acid desaturase [Cyanobacteria bacterium P01_D01_bin.105]